MNYWNHNLVTTQIGNYQLTFETFVEEKNTMKLILDEISKDGEILDVDLVSNPCNITLENNGYWELNSMEWNSLDNISELKELNETLDDNYLNTNPTLGISDEELEKAYNEALEEE